MIDFRGVLIRGFALSLAAVLSVSCSGRDSGEALDSAMLAMQPPATAPCNIAVDGRGTFDLESGYLPYVLACENPWAGPEALKALAIAARSNAYYYILKYGSVCDSQQCQVFTCSIAPQQQHFDAVNSTRNLFLKYNNNLTYGFYVAGDGGTEVWVTNNWGLTGTSVQQTGLGTVFSSSDLEYGQNRGCLSQDGSVELENNGWTYPDILRYYYGSDIQVPSLPSSCGGATTCDNGVAVGQTACNPADPGAQFVCVSPGLPSDQQWQRQACASGQQCVGTACQSTGQSCNSITDVAQCDAAGCAYYYCANACRPKGSDICQVCPGYQGCQSSCNSITDVAQCDAAGCAYYYCANACRPKGSDICQVCPGYQGCGATTCDNGVAVGQTACNPSDPGAQFVCVAPGQPSDQQWQRQACASGQQCVGTTCQTVSSSCESITDVAQCDAAGCAYYYCANACRPKGSDICQVCPGYQGCQSSCNSITDVAQCDAAGCAYYYCANACRPKGSDICQVCPGYQGCQSSCNSITDVAQCDAAGCAYYYCANACRPKGSDICQVCPGYQGCGTTAVCPAYGWFCGNDGVTNGQANTLYTCAAAGQAPTSSEVCANGCQIMPENTPDYCIQANGCSATGQAALNWEKQQLAAGNSYSNMCLAFVYYAYQAAGYLPSWLSGGTAAESMAKAQAAAGWTAWGGSCPCGAVLYWPASTCNGWAGHVVICNGDGTVSTSGWPDPYYAGSPNAQISWMNQQECSNNPVGYIVP